MPVFVPFLALNDVLFAIPVIETTSDLNGDGDTADLVLQLLDIASGAITNTARAIQTPGEGFPSPFFFGESDDAAIAFLVSEAEQGGVDLNRDGDTDDLVLHAASLEDRDRDGRFDFADECIGRARRCSSRR